MNNLINITVTFYCEHTAELSINEEKISITDLLIDAQGELCPICQKVADEAEEKEVERMIELADADMEEYICSRCMKEKPKCADMCGACEERELHHAQERGEEIGFLNGNHCVACGDPCKREEGICEPCAKQHCSCGKNIPRFETQCNDCKIKCNCCGRPLEKEEDLCDQCMEMLDQHEVFCAASEGFDTVEEWRAAHKNDPKPDMDDLPF